MPKHRAPRERLASAQQWDTAIANELRATLLWRGITQKQIVDVLGAANPNYVSRRVRGEYPMTAGELMVVADFFNEDVGALLTRAKHNAKHPPHGNSAMQVA